MKQDSPDGSAHTPMYNPNILPLKGNLIFVFTQLPWDYKWFN